MQPARLFLLVSLLLAGCQTHDGVTTAGLVVPQPRERYLIIGFGLVTVRPPGPAAARVVQERGVGVSLATQPALRASVGYVDYRVTSVPAAADAIVEARVDEDRNAKLTVRRPAPLPPLTRP